MHSLGLREDFLERAPSDCPTTETRNNRAQHALVAVRRDSDIAGEHATDADAEGLFDDDDLAAVRVRRARLRSGKGRNDVTPSTPIARRASRRVSTASLIVPSTEPMRDDDGLARHRFDKGGRAHRCRVRWPRRTPQRWPGIRSSASSWRRWAR